MSTLRRIYTPIQTDRIDMREDANSHKVSASTFQEVFARLSVGLPRLASASEAPFSRRTSTSWRWWLRGWSSFWC